MNERELRNKHYNSLRSIENTIEQTQRLLWALPTVDTLNEKQLRADTQKMCINLIPIIKGFKRDKRTFIMPNGQRIRFNKLKFFGRTSISKPDFVWNGISFKLYGEQSQIHYSFEMMIPKDGKLTSEEMTEKEYHFSPKLFRQNMNLALQILNHRTNEEIEAIALYGLRAPIEDKKITQRRNELNEEIKNLRELKSIVRKIYATEQAKQNIEDRFDNYGNLIKSSKSIKKTIEDFNSTMTLYSR